MHQPCAFGFFHQRRADVPRLTHAPRTRFALHTSTVSTSETKCKKSIPRTCSHCARTRFAAAKRTAFSNEGKGGTHTTEVFH